MTGSSPRGRGKRVAPPTPPISPRLIPAWAGKTRPRWRTGLQRRAHPRVGGENGRHSMPIVRILGSSPRGRGKPVIGAGLKYSPRLIPAWAGKTDTRLSIRHPPWAHPRVGGENSFSACRRANSRGSSPRGRGKPRILGNKLGFSRLIPAWAGKTWSCRSRSARPWAHPRVGGENRRL